MLDPLSVLEREGVDVTARKEDLLAHTYALGTDTEKDGMDIAPAMVVSDNADTDNSAMLALAPSIFG